MKLNAKHAALLAAAALAVGAGEARAQDEPPPEPQQTPPAQAEQPPAQAEQPPAQAEQPPAAQPDAEGFVTTETGLRYRIIQPAGEPRAAQQGDVVMVHYTGRFTDGTVFDTSLREVPRGRVMQVEPFIFTLGQGRVIRGWEQGIQGMRVGERRTLVIPPELAYGETGAGGGVIPPNATLVFDVELVGLWRPEPRPTPEVQQQPAEQPQEQRAGQ